MSIDIVKSMASCTVIVTFLVLGHVTQHVHGYFKNFELPKEITTVFKTAKYLGKLNG